MGKSCRKGKNFRASRVPFFVARVVPVSSKMWEEDRRRRGRGGAVYLMTSILLLYVDRSHYLLRRLYVY